MNTKSKPDFCLAFLKKGEVIPANLMPDTMDEWGLSFSYDAPSGSNFIINMDRKGRFSAERFEAVNEQWELMEGYNHDKAKALALEAGIIYLRKQD